MANKMDKTIVNNDAIAPSVNNEKVVLHDKLGHMTDGGKALIIGMYDAGLGCGSVAKELGLLGYGNIPVATINKIVSKAGIKRNASDKTGTMTIGKIETEIANVIRVMQASNATSETKSLVSASSVKAKMGSLLTLETFTIYYNRGLGIIGAEKKADKVASS